jgi:hypothetical protein
VALIPLSELKIIFENMSFASGRYAGQVHSVTFGTHAFNCYNEEIRSTILLEIDAETKILRCYFRCEFSSSHNGPQVSNYDKFVEFQAYHGDIMSFESNTMRISLRSDDSIAKPIRKYSQYVYNVTNQLVIDCTLQRVDGVQGETLLCSFVDSPREQRFYTLNLINNRPCFLLEKE